MTSFKWNGREVHNPVAKVVVGVSAVCLTVLVLAIVIPLSLPAHVVLRAFGRKGFVRHNSDGTISYEVDFDGFKADRS